MLTQDNIIVIAYSLPIYQLLYYSIQLISFKKSNPARKYLGALLLSMTLFLITNAMYRLDYKEIMTSFYYLYIPLFLSIPPFFYLYLNSLTNKDYQIGRTSKIVLFIPSLLVLLLNLFFYGTLTSHNRQLFLADDHTIFGASIASAGMPLILLWMSLSVVLLIQLVLASIKIRTIFTAVKTRSIQEPGYLAHFQYKWVIIIAFSLMTFMIAGALQILLAEPRDLPSSIIYNILMLISGGLAGYYGMKQDNLLTQVSGLGSYLKTPGKQELKSVSTENVIITIERAISDDEAQRIIQKIESFMQDKKPYLNKRFSLNDLSQQITEQKKNVSLVINDVMGKNFNGLVNEYRIRETLHIMETDTKNLTMDTIGDIVGFHSRSTFYACFKQFTGQTPKEYLLVLKQNGRKTENNSFKE